MGIEYAIVQTTPWHTPNEEIECFWLGKGLWGYLEPLDQQPEPDFVARFVEVAQKLVEFGFWRRFDPRSNAFDEESHAHWIRVGKAVWEFCEKHGWKVALHDDTADPCLFSYTQIGCRYSMWGDK